MSWVLILSGGDNPAPAVIGGYSDYERAVDAGRAAIAPLESKQGYQRPAAFHRFTVIPGAADSEPSRAAHGFTESDDRASAYPVKYITRVRHTRTAVVTASGGTAACG